VSHRGPLAIHASQTVDRAACQAHGIDPDELTTGALIGVVDLAEIVALDAGSFASQQERHLAGGFFAPPEPGEMLFGWRLAEAHALPQPVVYRGRMGLFNVPDALLADALPVDGDLPRQHAAPEPFPEPVGDPRPFELRVIRAPSNKPHQPAYRVALYQRFVEPPPAQQRMEVGAPLQMRLVAELGGDRLKAIADQLLEALREDGYHATDLSARRRAPFYLSEEAGVRLGLLFLAVRPLAKLGRVERISLGLRGMTAEELYYWYSKCTNTPHAERGQKALRILLAEE
jgi:hypothetical protein